MVPDPLAAAETERGRHQRIPSLTRCGGIDVLAGANRTMNDENKIRNQGPFFITPLEEFNV